ncbi:MAG: hypothetical protein A3K68_03905 [Euryarchaeota archaeon RBG_16_68_13]|nr:MAG: hypothetical protein A3K68_03905 [Euryarchaeota archaeon RBG_16_68_13]
MLVGTRKGAFIFHSGDRKRWSLLGPYFEGVPVYHMALDPRDGRTVYAAATSEHWGPSVHRARIGGDFRAGKSAPRFDPSTGLAVTRVWHVEPGPADEPGTLYAGVEPAALFRSDDGGDTWRGLDGLNLHPTRKGWQPGNGGLCLHSVLVDPRDPRHLLAGISAVGVWETRDSGGTWSPQNEGVRADFLPDKYPEWGQCVHHLAWDTAGDGGIFQQNHCGSYYRPAGQRRWTEVTKGLPSGFGFAIAAHPRRKRTAWVVPLEGDFNRVPPNGRLAVWRTTSAGKTWKRTGAGLPGPHAYMGVLREGLATDRADPVGLYLGTNTGKLYGSRDEGRSWREIADDLPPILSVAAGDVR